MITLSAFFVANPVGSANAQTLSQAISLDKRVSLFARAVVQCRMHETLSGSGPFIVFIPSDETMTREGSAFLLERVLRTETNAERLTDLVRHHVARATPQILDLPHDAEIDTLANVPLKVARLGTAVIVGGYAAVIDRIVADNGVAYLVDRLLWPRDPKWASGAGPQSGPRHLERAPAAGTR